jgi:hypothetical protein
MAISAFMICLCTEEVTANKKNSDPIHSETFLL